MCIRDSAYRLARGGVNFPVLNVGGMRFENDRIKIAKAVSVTTKEREAFEKLVEMGIDEMCIRDRIRHPQWFSWLTAVTVFLL